jgi:hypothetical protein
LLDLLWLSYLEVGVIVILAMPLLHAYQRQFEVDVGDFMIRYRQCVDGGVLLHDRRAGKLSNVLPIRRSSFRHRDDPHPQLWHQTQLMLPVPGSLKSGIGFT